MGEVVVFHNVFGSVKTTSSVLFTFSFFFFPFLHRIVLINFTTCYLIYYLLAIKNSLSVKTRQEPPPSIGHTCFISPYFLESNFLKLLQRVRKHSETKNLKQPPITVRKEKKLGDNLPHRKRKCMHHTTTTIITLRFFHIYDSHFKNWNIYLFFIKQLFEWKMISWC